MHDLLTLSQSVHSHLFPFWSYFPTFLSPLNYQSPLGAFAFYLLHLIGVVVFCFTFRKAISSTCNILYVGLILVIWLVSFELTLSPVDSKDAVWRLFSLKVKAMDCSLSLYLASQVIWCKLTKWVSLKAPHMLEICELYQP